MHKNKSLRNILKRVRANIEPCGTPDKIFLECTKDIFYSNILFPIF